MDFKQINKLAEYCRATLGNRLDSTELGNEYRYSMLPLCVVDAVYSIGVNYVGTARTVRDFATAVGLEGQTLYRANWDAYNSQAEQRQSISDFVAIQEQWAMQPTGILKFRDAAKTIYRNSQLTSSKYKSQEDEVDKLDSDCILKARAVYLFSMALKRFEVDYFQDIAKVVNDVEFEKAILSIPGSKSGKSLRYFFMLAGEERQVKPDRMIERFVSTGLAVPVKDSDKLAQLVIATADLLKQSHPRITPRLLDYIIWDYQRQKRL